MMFSNGKKGVPILFQIIGICIAMTVIVACGISFYLIPLFEQKFMENERSHIRNLVESAHSLVNDYYERSRKGEMTSEEARSRALERLAKMRYDRSGYFWINDIHPTMIMHPFYPELNGKDLSGFKDFDGNFLFVSMVKACEASGQGFVNYRWPEPGVSTPVKKLSFVKKFEPWGWIIGTGVYNTEIARSLEQLRYRLLIGTLMIVSSLVLINVWFAMRISKPLKRLAKFSTGLKDNLSARAIVEGSRETRDLAISLNETAEQLTRTLVSRDQLDTAFNFIRTILDSIPSSIMIFEVADRRIVDVNETFVRQSGRSHDEIIGETWDCRSCRGGGQDAGCDRCLIENAIISGELNTSEVACGFDGDQVRYLEVVVAPIKDQEGAVSQIVHISRDITARKHAEIILATKNEELAEALANLTAMQMRVLQTEKMASIGQLAAGVAHEINNPMGFINSNLTTLKKYIGRLEEYITFIDNNTLESTSEEAVRLTAEMRKKLKIVHILADSSSLIAESQEGAERVKNIVQDLKSFSRVDHAELSVVDINDSLKSTINIAWNEIKYVANLTKDFGQLPPLKCYPQQLNQVFLNLLINAGQAIEEQGDICVKTWSESDNVYISFSDTGKGMSPEIMNHIFEPFFTTKEVGKGTGLGLSISYDIIRKHNGDITISSQPGVGSTFTVRLPIDQQ